MYDCDLKANILIFYLYLAFIHKTWFYLDLHLNTFSVYKYFVLSENKQGSTGLFVSYSI
jgi:hypothetical protein